MTNIRLRIEDAVPTVGLGTVGILPWAGAGPTSAKAPTPTVAYRMAPVTWAMGETI